jgi:hypothetical protein
MNYRIAYERAVNVTASGLAMVVQRLPLIKNLTPIFGATGGSHFAAPLAVTFVGTHALSGQSIMLQQTNTIEPTDVVEVELGEAFQWEFKATRYNILSFGIVNDSGTEQLPSGIVAIGPQSGIGTIGGIPEEAGTFTLTITGYRGDNQRSSQTAPFDLTLIVEDPVESPFKVFMSDYFSAEELANPAITGPAADPDLDGIDNTMEFVLDLNPLASDSMPGAIGLDSNDPQMLRYEIPLNGFATETTVGFEESTSLEGSWQPVSGGVVERTDTMIVLTAPLAGKKFYRLKVIVEE